MLDLTLLLHKNGLNNLNMNTLLYLTLAYRKNK